MNSLHITLSGLSTTPHMTGFMACCLHAWTVRIIFDSHHPAHDCDAALSGLSKYRVPVGIGIHRATINEIFDAEAVKLPGCRSRIFRHIGSFYRMKPVY